MRSKWKFVDFPKSNRNGLTVDVKGDGCAFASGDSQVGGHAAVVPPCVSVNWLDGQVATCGHPLSVWEHLLMVDQKKTPQLK